MGILLRPTRCSLCGKRIGPADLLEFVTSSECITSTESAVQYNMLASAVTLCCDECSTCATLSEEFRVVFRFTHTSTFELNSSVASAYQKLGDKWWRIRAAYVV